MSTTAQESFAGLPYKDQATVELPPPKYRAGYYAMGFAIDDAWGSKEMLAYGYLCYQRGRNDGLEEAAKGLEASSLAGVPLIAAAIRAREDGK